MEEIFAAMILIIVFILGFWGMCWGFYFITNVLPWPA